MCRCLKEVKTLANSELKRVGLIFTQEGAVDFKKTLQEVNIEMSKNYNQFKLTQSQWDSSTNSTQKLIAQQEYLSNAYELQQDKVSVLRSQLADLENAENKNTTAIKKKQNELTNAQIKLNNYQKQLEEIKNKLNSLGRKLEETGEKIQKIGEKIGKAGKKLSAFSIASTAAFMASTKGAIDFEDAFAGVEKTVDGTKQQMEELKQGIREMAKQLPSTTTEISAVAESAGQLGIQTENILSFSKAMIDLGNSTNLSAEEAASQLAKFANIMQMSQQDFDRLGSSIVDLGNHFATTEADIVDMSMRLAGAGKQVGLSEGEVLGLATALSSVGIEAEMGGSAISKAMVKMQNAVEQGGIKLNDVLKKTGLSLRELELMSANDSMGFKSLSQSIGMTSTEIKQLITAGTNLEDFSRISGMTAEEFKKKWKEDAVGALSEFIKGLGDAESKGQSAITMLSEMGLTEVRLRDSLLRAANAGTLLNDAVETGTKAWEDNSALTNEANKRYDTLKSKITIVLNKIKDLGITIGNKLMPFISKLVIKIEELTKWFENLTEEQINFILEIAGTIAVLGPIITIIGKINSTLGGTIKSIGIFTQAIGVMKGTLTSTSTAVTGLSSILTVISNPITLACVGIAGLTAIMWQLGQSADSSVVKMTEQIEVFEKQKQTLEELNRNKKEYLSTNLAEIENVQKLKNELSTLVDENGRVKEGYKGRVSFILGELNNALGTEYEATDGVISKYKELTDSIDQVIEKKKAQIILNSMEEEYTNALKSRGDAIKNLAVLERTYSSDKQKIIDKENEKAELQKKKQDMYTLSRMNKLAKEIKTLEENTSAYEEQRKTIIEYNKTIDKYETTSATVKEGNVEKIKELNTQYTNSYRQRKDDTIQSLAEQLEYESINLELQRETYNENQSEITKNQMLESQKRLETLAQELVNSTSTVNELTPEQITAWTNLAAGAYDVYSEYVSKMPTTMQEKIHNATGIIAGGTPQMQAKAKELGEKTVAEFDRNADAKQKALSTIEGYLRGLSDDEKREMLKQIGIKNADIVIDELNKGNLSEQNGRNILEGLWKGLSNGKWQGKIIGVASGLAKAVNKAFTGKDGWDEHSPSKKMKKYAENYIEPISTTLENKKRGIIKQAKNFARDINSVMDNSVQAANGQNTELNKKYNYNKKQITNKIEIHIDKKVDDEELENIFNYITKKFGVEYR